MEEENSVIESGIANLNADSMSTVRGSDSEMGREMLSDLELVQQEVDEVYDKHGSIADDLPRDRVHCYVSSFKRLHGQCQYHVTEPNGPKRKDHYVIRIAENIIGDDKHNWRDTVRHELAHALAFAKHGSSQSHNTNWKCVAMSIGADPTRCASSTHTEYEYMTECPNGCGSWGRHRLSKSVKAPWMYTCQNCGENIVSYDAGDTPPELPGTCGVESVEWDSADDVPPEKLRELRDLY